VRCLGAALVDGNTIQDTIKVNIETLELRHGFKIKKVRGR
jgi:hypothetical protein